MRNRGFQSPQASSSSKTSRGHAMCCRLAEVRDTIPGMKSIGNQVTFEAAQEIGARKSRVVII